VPLLRRDGMFDWIAAMNTNDGSITTVLSKLRSAHFTTFSLHLFLGILVTT